MTLDYGDRTEITSLNRLLWGRILTQVEAAMPPGKQCDQLKSLLKQHLRQFQDDLERILDGYRDTESHNPTSSSSRNLGFSDGEGSSGVDRGTRAHRESNVSTGDSSSPR